MQVQGGVIENGGTLEIKFFNTSAWKSTPFLDEPAWGKERVPSTSHMLQGVGVV